MPSLEAKLRLAYALNQVLEARKLSQADAAKVLGVRSRKEVNAIKHEAIGVYRGRRANLNAALAAVNQILDLAEALA